MSMNTLILEAKWRPGMDLGVSPLSRFFIQNGLFTRNDTIARLTRSRHCTIKKQRYFRELLAMKLSTGVREKN